MFDIIAFNKEINALIRGGQEKSAEGRMLKAYSELKALSSLKELQVVAGRLAHFYSMPQTEDLGKAETYFLDCETLAPGAYSKSQTAMFYFYVLRDFSKTIRKVDEIKDLLEAADLASYYSALALKGQALIKLEMLSDAKTVLDELRNVINMNAADLPYGDEINLLEAAFSSPILAPICREILQCIIPKIRSQEYGEKAKVLLKSL